MHHLRRLAWRACGCRGLALLLLSLTMLPATAAAQPAELAAADRLAIQTVISRQIEAFRQDDGATAFSFASPGIQALFGTPEVFMQMVRQSYRPVYRPREVRFDELIARHAGPTQRVILVGPENEVVVALYEMQRQPDGSWRINGCYLLAADEKAT